LADLQGRSTWKSQRFEAEQAAGYKNLAEQNSVFVGDVNKQIP
jgi:hypothetical protein